jgi:hypothetical protein
MRRLGEAATVAQTEGRELSAMNRTTPNLAVNLTLPLNIFSQLFYTFLRREESNFASFTFARIGEGLREQELWVGY